MSISLLAELRFIIKPDIIMQENSESVIRNLRLVQFH